MDLSVCIVTFNHAPYIAQSLDGVLAQKLPLNWEVLVGEDGSTDGTREIVRDYAARHPQRIRAFFHEYPPDYVRGNGKPNFMNNMRSARGKYIALLEGDDYWTCPDKLRLQVELLEREPRYSGCFHNVMISREVHPERDTPYLVGPQPTSFDIRTLASAGRNVVPSCSVVFRRGLFGEYPKWFETLPIGDWALHLLNAEHGPLAYMDEFWGVYRVHGGGVWSSMRESEKLKSSIVGARVLDRHFEHRYRRDFGRSIYKWEMELAVGALRERRYKDAVGDCARAVLASPGAFRAEARSVLPRLVRALGSGVLRRSPAGA